MTEDETYRIQSDDDSFRIQSDDADSYHILPSEDEVRREAVGKLVECSILKDRVADIGRDIDNLRYLLKILDDTIPTRDEGGNVDIRPVYRRLRKEIMDLTCQQMDMEERMDALQREVNDTECMSNVKVVVKKL